MSLKAYLYELNEGLRELEYEEILQQRYVLYIKALFYFVCLKYQTEGFNGINTSMIRVQGSTNDTSISLDTYHNIIEANCRAVF